jgi:hypothetical protein
MSAQSSHTFEYDVCFTFAGEDRPYVQKVANELKKSGVRIFYDQYEQANLWGKDLYVHLDEVYRHKARYCIMFISHQYALKLWTNHERRSAQARAFSENREYILPARFDDTEVPGLPPTVGYISLKDMSPKEFAALVKHKLQEATEERIQPQVFSKPPAVSVDESQSAVEKLQNYLVDDRYRIALYQLIVDQREALVAQLSEEEFPLKESSSIDDIWARLQRYDGVVMSYLDFVITGCRWSTPNQFSHWIEFMERVANSNGRRFGEFNTLWTKLRLYPTLVLFYAIGIICVSGNRYDMLNSIFNTKIIDRNTDEDATLILAMSTNRILDKEIANQFAGYERQYTPLNNHLFEVLKRPLQKHILDERKYESYFDLFEFLLACTYADLDERKHTNQYGDVPRFGPGFWGPIGRFGWKRNMTLKVPFQELVREATEAGSKWPPLAAGMFSGSSDRFLEVYNGIIDLVNKISWH